MFVGAIIFAFPCPAPDAPPPPDREVIGCLAGRGGGARFGEVGGVMWEGSGSSGGEVFGSSGGGEEISTHFLTIFSRNSEACSAFLNIS